MELQDRINNNIQYFKSVEVQNGVLMLRVTLKKGWGIVEYKDERLKAVKSDQADLYFFYGKIEDKVTIDELFDYFEYVVKFNLDIEDKKQLFKQKHDELITLFSERELEDLKTLSFVLECDKPKRGRKKKIEKEEEKVIKEKESTENTETNVDFTPISNEIKNDIPSFVSDKFQHSENSYSYDDEEEEEDDEFEPKPLSQEELDKLTTDSLNQYNQYC